MASHYIDNKKFYAAIKEYKDSVEVANQNNAEKPVIPRYIGECLLMIATRLSTKPNFVRYPYRDEMISDGVENCITYFDNFDPSRSNPFAYFTQIIYYAFLRRIQKEKKQLYVKHKVMENMVITGSAAEFQEGDDDGRIQIGEIDNDQIFDFVKTFEEKRDAKRQSAKTRGLEKFLETPEEDNDEGEEQDEDRTDN